MAARLHIQAPAKVNLLLKVLGRRPDGFHEIRTVFQAIDLTDELTVEIDGSGIIRRDFELGGGHIGGIVVDENGNALSVPIQLLEASDTSSNEYVASGARRSDSDGRFAFEHVPAGSYRLLVDSNGDWFGGRRGGRGPEELH